MHRAGLMFVVALGCYSPSPPAGAPCSTTGECPTGLTCGPANTCVAASDGDGGVDASGGSTLVHARVGFTVVLPDGELQDALDPTALQVYLADGTQPAIVAQPDGSIEFQRGSAAQIYVVVDGATVIYGSTPSLVYMPDAFGRTTLVPVTQTTLLDATLGHGSDITGGYTTVFATGQRSELDGASDPFTFSIDWGGAYLLAGGAPGLLDASQGDELWFLHYTTDSDGVTSIDTAVGSAVTQIDGSDTMIASTLAAPSDGGCVRIDALAATESARFAGVVPSHNGVSAYLGVSSEPAATKAAGGEYTLAYVQVSADTTTDLAYTQPFSNEGVLVNMELDLEVDHKVNGGQIIKPTAVLISDIALTSATQTCDAQSIVSLPPGPAIPTTVTIDGTPLANDNQKVESSGNDLDVVIAASAGSADFYTIQIWDVGNGNNDYVATYISASPETQLDRGAFQNNRTYQLIVSISTGYPNAATGDLSTTTPPIGFASVPSYTFQVE